jgi:hypothetical protein
MRRGPVGSDGYHGTGNFDGAREIFEMLYRYKFSKKNKKTTNRRREMRKESKR